MKKLLIASLAVGLSATALAQVQQFPPSKVLYSNTENNENTDFSLPGGVIIGDEVFLDFGLTKPDDAPAGAEFVGAIDNIFFQYFADINVDATLRLYANDGSEIAGSSAPGTLLFESSPFTLPRSAAASVELPLSEPVWVPQNFTWSLEVTQDDLAGLSVYSQPEVGQGFQDFWQGDKQQDGTVAWSRRTLQGVTDSSFAAIISGTPVLVPEPSTWAMIGLGSLLLGGRFVRRKK